MATAIQFGGKAKRLRVQLDPALKEFLDVVVIPALVKAYLLENPVGENRLALLPNGVTHSDARDSALGQGVP